MHMYKATFFFKQMLYLLESRKKLSYFPFYIYLALMKIAFSNYSVANKLGTNMYVSENAPTASSSTKSIIYICASIYHQPMWLPTGNSMDI